MDKPVAEQTLAELKEQDAGRWKGERWAGERIPALEEAIARNDRSTIRAVLKDAVPEFGSHAA